MSKRRFWLICVGSGYGWFVFKGTEREAEKMRAHKANWEATVATKREITSVEASILGAPPDGGTTP